MTFLYLADDQILYFSGYANLLWIKRLSFFLTFKYRRKCHCTDHLLRMVIFLD